MNYLISLGVLLLILVPRNQRLPEEFYQIPEPVGAKATLIVTATYAQGRGPCIFMADGSRRWALESWFRIKQVYRGQVGGNSIYIKRRVSPKTEDAGVELEVGRDYLVLLRPSKKSMKAIKAGAYLPAWDALHDEEIIAIVELK
ncbi:MAG TPA: hypothetical protein VKA60_12560 [Blastocatellia bacterium]|nr:hypothetical protein [Blastocatellia bacterium]